MAIIVPTKRCNLRCRHCMRDDYDDRDLDLDLYARYLRDQVKHGQPQRISLTGGEPTLHAQLGEMLQISRKLGFSVAIMSNGQDQQAAQTVVRKAGAIRAIGLSVDGPNAELNDQIRGQGAFRRLTESIVIYTKSKRIRRIFVRAVVTTLNKDHIPAYFRLAEQYGVRLHFTTLHPVTKAYRSGLEPTRADLALAYKSFVKEKKAHPQVQAAFGRRHYRPFTKPEWPKTHCLSAQDNSDRVMLLPDGKVAFCCDLPDIDFVTDRYQGPNEPLDYVLGDFNHESFDTILEKTDSDRGTLSSTAGRQPSRAADGRAAVHL